MEDRLRSRSILIALVTLAGCLSIACTAYVHVIPSWSAFNMLAPLLVGVASLSAVGVMHWREAHTSARKWLRRARSAGLSLLLVIVMLGSLLFALVTRYLGPFPERTYAFDGPMKTLYLFELPCFPPDNSTECNEYSTEIRTRVGFLPFTRTVARCSCFYAEPKVTDSTIELAVQDTYVRGTPPALIDRKTLRLILPRSDP